MQSIYPSAWRMGLTLVIILGGLDNQGLWENLPGWGCLHFSLLFHFFSEVMSNFSFQISRTLEQLDLYWSVLSLGFPGAASCKEPTCQCRRHKGPMSDPWVRKIPLMMKWQPTPVFWPGEFHGQRSLPGYGPSYHKELDTSEQLSMHVLSLEFVLVTGVVLGWNAVCKR